MAKHSIKEKEGTIINSVREDYFSAYAKAELNDQSVWLIGNRCLKNNSNIPNMKKHYVKWQCYIAAQWLRKLKTQQ